MCSIAAENMSQPNGTKLEILCFHSGDVLTQQHKARNPLTARHSSRVLRKRNQASVAPQVHVALSQFLRWAVCGLGPDLKFVYAGYGHFRI
jgi:hypothetical protein